ncbi:MAG: hypothetical protein PVH87_00300 [Desulfobacteraceae bacterium]|jgi:hypothetical protein
MNVPIYGHLQLHFEKYPTAAFLPFLQKGFYVEISTGNLLEILCRTCGLDAQQVHQRIQTVFLNGKPVDDMASVYVRDKDCLALSAAMPGLVGATMRSGGVLAGFRHSISHRPEAAQSNQQGGVLSIKLFNLLIKEIGLRLLRQGILVKGDDLQDLMTALSEHDWKHCKKVELNAQKVDTDTLKTMEWPQGPGFVCLQVTVGCK